MKTLGQRVKVCRLTLKKIHGGFTQKIIAGQLGMEQPSYSEIEAGFTSQPRNVQKLAEILKTTPEWLQFGSGNPPSYLSKMINFSLGINYLIQQNKIPVITWDKVPSWLRDYEDFQLTEGIELIDKPSFCSNKCYGLKIKGDAMVNDIPGRKTFLEGETIIIDPQKPHKSGDFVIAHQSKAHEAILRQYIAEGADKYLRPLNRQYNIININENIQINGVVVGRFDVL